MEKSNEGAKMGRERIEKMSAEVVDSNPYSRLMALQRMGIVKEYERIRQKSVAVVGMYHPSGLAQITTMIEFNERNCFLQASEVSVA